MRCIIRHFILIFKFFLQVTKSLSGRGLKGHLCQTSVRWPYEWPKQHFDRPPIILYNAVMTKESKDQSKKAVHDYLFRDVYTKKKYSLDLFRLSFSPLEFELFNWETLKTELTTFMDDEWKAKRADLAFSVELKDSQKKVKVILLLEHKSSENKNVLTQLLSYQARIYSHHNYPIIPIIVYHGEKKKWQGPLEFHQLLEGLTPTLQEQFGKNILNFTCRLLNIQELNISKTGMDLTSEPVLLILQNIWDLDDKRVAEVIRKANKLPEKDRQELLGRAFDYIQQYDKNFTWKRLRDIESITLEKGESIMIPLTNSLEKAEKKGIEKGKKEGIEQGKKLGIQDVALKMFEQGLDLEIISKTTGLLKRELEKLRMEQRPS